MSGIRLRDRRLLVFAVVVAVALAGVAVAARHAVREAALADVPTAATASDLALDLVEVRRQPHVVFRSTASGPTYGRIAAVPLAEPAGPRAVGEVECERVHANREHAVCLTAERGVITTYESTLLDAALRPERSWPLGGPPSRTRLARDGSAVSTTVFVTGHSYAGGSFSTETVVQDLRAERSLGNLEEFEVVIDGERVTAVDLNVWGVTFPAMGGDRFFATVATGGRLWLAEGDLATRTLRAVREGVECPSLSPDGRRLAFKSRQSGPDAPLWRVHVLDLATGAEWQVAEPRNVDDQVEWLDDGRLLYGLPRDDGSGESDVWVVPAQGGAPEVFVPRAWSPAVVR